MELSELAAYAEEKYHIREEHKWAEFPGFSVLADPGTGKWAALLMRQWDYETGTELQRCDIKCGKECIAEMHAPYLSGAFRMKGQKWVGVTFDERTDPKVVFKLFDTALRPEEKHGRMIVLEALKGNYPKGPAASQQKVFTDTAIPARGQDRFSDRSIESDRLSDRSIESDRLSDRSTGSDRFSNRRADRADTGASQANSRRGTFEQNRFINRGGEIEFDGYKPPRVETQRIGRPNTDIPRKILEMMQLYEYGTSSFEMKCRNFYRQGKFMEDYEDNAPWNGEFSRYFTTYHDLNLHLLRGYFSWRTLVRRGEYRRITTSLAYMYLYELLNGIGTKTPQESFDKMKAFEAGYLDSGIGDPAMRENLHKWMKEFAILNGAPLETVMSFMDPVLLARDHSLEILKMPQDHTDEEICIALNALTGGKIEKSPVYIKDAERGTHLFAAVWRYMTIHCREDERDLFTACFGKRKSYQWRPLANAVYYDRTERKDTVYVINACRRYVYSNDAWKEERYDELFFDKYRVHAVVHETDRQLRRYLKAGHYLREKQGEEWIKPYVEAVIRQDQEEIAEAAKPRITIDLSGLDKIRKDALITRDSLLTEEEKMEAVESFTIEVDIPELDNLQAQILLSVMRGEPVAELLRSNHLMASVVADAINEALYDEIGDSVLICDGDDMELVEDYREDLEFILGGI